MRFPIASLCLAGAALAACEGSPSEPDLEPAYVLVSVDGRPLPATTDSSTLSPSGTIHFRIVARTLELLSSDSAQYTQVEDAVQAGRQIRYDCWTKRIAYRREGPRLVLTIDPNDPGTPPSLAQPLIIETLEVGRGRLVHQLTGPPSRVNPSGLSLRLEYAAADPPAQRCVGAPASTRAR
ncbi:MAG TPA: hypothetical protein VF746_05080 [Longimicrobium sp.]|jgi:hypothetical protein